MRRLVDVLCVLILCACNPAHSTTAPTQPRPADSPAALEQVKAVQHKAGDTYICWAENNNEMPDGYEILCRDSDH